MRLIDVHAHIQQHDAGEIDGMLTRAEEAGVGAIIAAGVTVDDSKLCIELAAQHKMILAGVGVHPTDLKGRLTSDDLAKLDAMASDNRVVVMSEVGIDHQEHVLGRDRPEQAGGFSWAEIQDEAFRQQIEIARGNDLPIVFHIREPGDDPDAASAWPASLKIFDETNAGELGGAAHYFQGNEAAARSVLEAGFMISFARSLIRFKRLQEIAKWLPMDRIVLETDSYPQPFKKDRMKWTEPRHLLDVAECLAQVRGISLGETIERTSENALSMVRDRNGSVSELLQM